MFKSCVKSIFLVSLFVLASTVCSLGHAASVQLDWTNPTTRESGVPLAASEISVFQLQLDGVAIATGPATTVSNLYAIAEGTCLQPTNKFQIRVQDTGGQWSKLSPVASVTAQVCTPKSPPATVTNVKITVIP